MITSGEGGVYIDLVVQPKARRPGVRGEHGGRLKIAVAEPASGGRANQAVVETLSALLNVTKGEVTLVAGKTSRRKRVFVRGVGTDEALEVLTSATSVN